MSVLRQHSSPNHFTGVEPFRSPFSLGRIAGGIIHFFNEPMSADQLERHRTMAALVASAGDHQRTFDVPTLPTDFDATQPV